MTFVPQTNYGIYTSYYWDYGLRGVPMAGPPGTSMQVVAEHAPTCYKVVNWVAQAQDSADPQPPDWNTGNSNEVLAQKAISAPMLTDLGDGSVLTTVVGIYVYLLLVPPSDTDQLQTAAPPWDSSLAAVITPGAFMQLLKGVQINATGNYAGMPGQNVPQPILKPFSGGTTSLTGGIAVG
jgi:hypothetical protein